MPKLLIVLVSSLFFVACGGAGYSGEVALYEDGNLSFYYPVESVVSPYEDALYFEGDGACMVFVGPDADFAEQEESLKYYVENEGGIVYEKGSAVFDYWFDQNDKSKLLFVGAVKDFFNTGAKHYVWASNEDLPISQDCQKQFDAVVRTLNVE